MNSVGGNTSITYNPLLENLSGLQALYSIGGSLWIGDNNSIENLSGLSNLNHAEGIQFLNSSPESISGLENLESKAMA